MLIAEKMVAMKDDELKVMIGEKKLMLALVLLFLHARHFS